MSRVINQKSERAQGIQQQPTLPKSETLVDAESSDIGSNKGKDETELELERLIFGDDTGFKEGLKLYRLGTLETVHEDHHKAGEGGGGEGGSGEEEDLEALEDADVGTQTNRTMDEKGLDRWTAFLS